jgi:uncharacterized membrane protein YkvA (DUF1232 family)
MARLGRRAALTALWSAIRASHRGGPSLGQRIGSLPRLLGATVSGRYDGKARVFAMVLAGCYILSPIDLFPEALFSVFGLIDDSFVAVWLAGAVLSETDRFMIWERQRERTIPRRMARDR